MLPQSRVNTILKRLIKSAQESAHLSDIERFSLLWYDGAKMSAHIKRRMCQSHITHLDEYKRKTYDALSKVTVARIAGDIYFEVELDSVVWSVVLNAEGQIKTSYPRDASHRSFTENQRRRGYKVYEIILDESIRAELGALFATR